MVSFCRKIVFLLFVFISIPISNAQIKGTIKDQNKQPLAYASIYIEGTSIGTVTNASGDYELELKEIGEYNITCQYVGYKKETFTIRYDGKPVTKHIVLTEDENILSELVITADREDPAYAIIRKAIKKRNYYKNHLKSYEADLYVKGLVKITQSPKKILGEEIGTMNGILDTTGQGIVYLSESKSKFYYQHPNKTKEIMTSSVTSGSNSLFSANQFSWTLSFDIYSEYLNFSRSVVSPIADVAFSYYDYKLEKTIIDETGIGINKIRLIPKSKNDPLLTGYIYITDDLWNVHSTDIVLAGSALKNTFLDTIAIKQIYLPVKDPDVWKLFSQVISFRAGLLGFKMGGNFTYIFSDYQPEKNVSEHFVTNETFKVDKAALNKDTLFWQKTRPVPLTDEEIKDYVQKDSLQRLWNTKSYMDSVDRKNNRLRPMSLISGYTYANTYRKQSWTYTSPLNTLRFNAVEGLKLDASIKYQKSDSLYRRWILEPRLQYGFSDEILKPSIHAEYRYDNYNQGFFTFDAGKRNIQFDPREPVNERGNSWASLWSKLNGIRLYESNFVEAGYRREVFNGFYINLKSGYHHRKPVKVNSNYSFRFKNQLYEENIPSAALPPSSYAENKYWKNKINILIRPAQKYSSYPNFKDRDASDWPNVEIEFESGIPLESNSSQFNKLTLRVRDRYLNLRLLGYTSYNIEGGKYFGAGPSFFGDYFHPMGNEFLMPIEPDLSSFNLLPFYSYSTDLHYAQFNFRHHFNGFITDKIPLLNKTPLKLVFGFSAMSVPEKSPYSEAIIGFENFRIGPIKLFDIDYTWAFGAEGLIDHGITIRLSQVLNN